jgi:4-hydroxybenzoate polyprenyltransferase
VRALLRACHPAPTVAVTLIATLLAVGTGLGSGRSALFAAAVLSGQLSIGWSNDRLDAARDRAAGRVDKPAARGAVPLSALTVAAAGSLATSIPLSLTLGWRPGLCALVLVAAGWLYNAGLKATAWSGAAYAVGFAALPTAPYLALRGHPWPPWWAPATGALLGIGAHFANVLPDLDDDARTGIRGLPHRLGERRSAMVMACALGGAALTVSLGSAAAPSALDWATSAVGLVLAGAIWWLASARPSRPLAFRATIVLAALDVVLFVLRA